MYFRKTESQLDNKWTVGKVEQVIRGRDQKIRKVIIKYRNASEENILRFTERSVRKLVKLFSIDEYEIQDDLSELQKRIDKLQGDSGLPIDAAQDIELHDDGSDGQEAVPDDEPVQAESDAEDELAGDLGEQDDQDPDGPAGNTRSKKRCNCCCPSHCKLSFHTMGPSVRSYTSSRVSPMVGELGNFAVDLDVTEKDEFTDYIGGEMLDTEADSISKMLKSLNIVM